MKKTIVLLLISISFLINMSAIANHGLIHVNFDDENWLHLGDADFPNNSIMSYYVDLNFLKLTRSQIPSNEPIQYKIRTESNKKQTLANFGFYSSRLYRRSDCDSGKSQLTGAELYEKSNLQGEMVSFSRSIYEAPWENFEPDSADMNILNLICSYDLKAIESLEQQQANERELALQRELEQKAKEEKEKEERRLALQREEKELAKQKELDKKIRELRLAREMKQAKEEKEREAKEKAKEQRRLELQKKAEEKKLERFCNKAGNFDLKECSAVKKKKIEEERRSLAAQNYCDDYDVDCLQRIVNKQYRAMQTCNGPSAGITEEMGRWLLAICIRDEPRDINACYRFQLNNWKDFILGILRMQQTNHYCK